MDDLTGKLMELLSNKENMDQIKSLGNMLNESNVLNADLESEKPAQSPQNHESSQTNGPLKVLDSTAIPVDLVQTVVKLMPLLSSINKDDDNTRLLYALRPHLSEKRRGRLDESMKIMQMLKLLPILKSQGIF